MVDKTNIEYWQKYCSDNNLSERLVLVLHYLYNHMDDLFWNVSDFISQQSEIQDVNDNIIIDIYRDFCKDKNLPSFYAKGFCEFYHSSLYNEFMELFVATQDICWTDQDLEKILEHYICDRGDLKNISLTEAKFVRFKNIVDKLEKKSKTY